jgi:hypothetical protein
MSEEDTRKKPSREELDTDTKGMHARRYRRT